MTDDARLDATPQYRAEDAARQEAAARWTRYLEEQRRAEDQTCEVALATFLADVTTPETAEALVEIMSRAFRAGFAARAEWL